MFIHFLRLVRAAGDVLVHVVQLLLEFFHSEHHTLHTFVQHLFLCSCVCVCVCVCSCSCVCVCVCAFVCVCDLPLLLASPSLVGPSINNSQASAQIFISEQKLTFHYNYEMKSSQSFHIFEIESAQPRSKFFLVSVLTAYSADKSGETTQKLERKMS